MDIMVQLDIIMQPGAKHCLHNVSAEVCWWGEFGGYIVIAGDRTTLVIVYGTQPAQPILQAAHIALRQPALYEGRGTPIMHGAIYDNGRRI